MLIVGLANAEITSCRRENTHGLDFDEAGFRAHVAQKAICDLKGKRIFNVTHIAKIRNWPGKIILPIYYLACDLSGMTESSRQEAEKNSRGRDQSADAGDS